MVDASLVNFAELGVLTVGVVVALQQLRDIKKTREVELETRQARLFMEIYNHFNAQDFKNQVINVIFQQKWRDYEDWLQKYSAEADPEAYSCWLSVASYYEGIGVLVKRKLIDKNIVIDLLYAQISITWEKMEPIAKGFRKVHPAWTRSWQWFEYLANEINRLNNKH